MRKKTIKFYSFKNNNINNIFSFSKRAIKQTKQFNSLIRSGLSSRIKGIIKETPMFNLFKFYSLNRKRKQWVHATLHLKTLFNRSYYLTNDNLNFFLKNTPLARKQLHIWFFFKNHFSKDLYLIIKNYPTLGILSSHFVHFISKKNVSYQNRSKYDSKIMNLSPVFMYVYLYALFVHKYTSLLNSNLYFFTSNLSKQSSWVDEDFGKHTSNWLVCNKKDNVINLYDYNIHDYNLINKNLQLLNSYNVEIDPQKKEQLNTTIKTIFTESQLNLIYFSQLHYNSVFNVCTYQYNYNVYVFNILYNYH